ncbi:MAG: hypothetical protein ABI832_09420 [bacterium]
MAYAAISTDTIVALVKNFNELAKDYDKADKKGQKTIKADLEVKAKKIQGVLDKDLAIYNKNASERYTNIDNQLARAVTLIKDGQKALATYAKSRKFDDLMSVNILDNAFGDMKRLEKDDDKAYSTAQFGYRNNPCDFSPLDKIFGDKYTKSFREVRKSTIDEGKKHIQPKLTKIDQLSQLALTLVKDAESAASKSKASLEDVRLALKTQTEDLSAHLKGDQKGQFGKFVTDVTKGADTVVKRSTEGEIAVEMIQSLLDDVLGSIKSAKAVGDGLKQRSKAAIAKVSKEAEKDKTVSGYIKALGLLSGQIDTKLKSLPPHYQSGLKALTAYRKKKA